MAELPPPVPKPSSDGDDRRAKGRALRERAQGIKAEALQDALAATDSEMAEWADEFIFGRVWAREGLDFQERAIVAIVALAVGGHTEQLRNYLHGALQDGVESEKIHESLVMCCVYAGFPSTLRALACWRDVLRAHQGK